MKIHLLIKSTYQSQDNDGYEFWLPEVVKCFATHEEAFKELMSYKGYYDEDSVSYHIEEHDLLGDIAFVQQIESAYYTKDKMVERIVELSAECEKLEKILRGKKWILNFYIL